MKRGACGLSGSEFLACADTFLDAEESEEEDADKNAYKYEDLAAAFDQDGFDGLSQSDTSGGSSMHDDDDAEEKIAGPSVVGATKKQAKQKGKSMSHHQ